MNKTKAVKQRLSFYGMFYELKNGILNYTMGLIEKYYVKRKFRWTKIKDYKHQSHLCYALFWHSQAAFRMLIHIM